MRKWHNEKDYFSSLEIIWEVFWLMGAIKRKNEITYPRFIMQMNIKAFLH